MRNSRGKAMPIPKGHTVGIYGKEGELIFTYVAKADAEKMLKMLRAPPDGPARAAAMAFAIRNIV